MFVLFEEDGAFKVGTLFSESDASLQVEMASGKRSKIKRTAVLLMFEQPGRDALMPAAQEIAQGLDPQFLWECAPQDEFSFTDFAREVFSNTPRSDESAGLLMVLHQSPMYFYRKGRGRYRAAPQDALKAALAGAERKRQAALEQQRLHEAIVAGEMPTEIKERSLMLLVRPDKQSVAFKALESAAQALQMAPARLLLSRGALPSAYSLHRARFLQQCFPAGTAIDVPPDEIDLMVRQSERLSLPQAPSPAYSIDDATTTEIDDAFSLQELAEGGWRVGIHIAAPAAAIGPESALGQSARERASTVYFPGEKITMLPEAVIAAYSLDEGRARPALSLYVDFNSEGERVASQSRLERVQIQQNIRLGDWERALEFPDEQIASADLPWAGLKPLLMLARRLRQARERVRGRPEAAGRPDFNFYVQWNAANPQALLVGDGQPQIIERRRGSAVDVLVSEFMILANTTWGDALALARLPAVYRVQTLGRVRMQTQPGPHQGLGVQNYAWSTSPLRRFSDLLNQWQMLAVLGHRQPVYRGNEADLFSSVTQFDEAYNHYADFQQTMEFYWAQRWLAMAHGLENHESWTTTGAGIPLREPAIALRGGGFRLRRAPLICRCADAPELTPGVEVELDILAADALELSLQARFVQVLSMQPETEEDSIMLPRHYAVLGSPIAHSKSPVIHALFAQQTGEDLEYQAIQVAPAELAAEIERLIANGWGGVNLTVPLKEHAFGLARAADWEISARALSACAVNTLRFDGHQVFADNTDGIGLVRDLERLLGAAGALQDASVVVIGAGGAAQGIVGPLRESGIRSLLLVNRNLQKAQEVAARWQSLDATAADWLSVAPLELLAEPWTAAGPELVINATSASLAEQQLVIHPSVLSRARAAVDMMYGPAPTVFMQQAQQAGAARVADGLGMLVEQAAEAFFLWRGVRPETASVLAELRLQLAPPS